MQPRHFTREEIAALLPQQPPYFFLDSAEVDAQGVQARYAVDGAGWILDGHFKNDPVLPASIGFEALGQAACLWVLVNRPPGLNDGGVLFSRMDGACFHHKARPGDCLEMELRLLRCHAPLVSFEGVIRVGTRLIAEVEKLSLAFGLDPVPTP